MWFATGCKKYLEDIFRNYKSGNATEVSYYSALKDLVQYFVHHSDLNAQIIISPKKTESGMPDLLLKRDVSLLGYMEAKYISFLLVFSHKREDGVPKFSSS
jgi:hypothetical protein